MPSLWCGATCGWRRKVFHCPQLAQTFRNSRSRCISHSQTPSLILLKMRKVQLGKHRITATAPIVDGAVIMSISVQASGYTPATTTLRTLLRRQKQPTKPKTPTPQETLQDHPQIIVRPVTQEKYQQSKQEMSMTTN